VVAACEDGGWRFEVADNGIGIATEYHDYVFEMFRRLHTHAAIAGVGVGLALCKRIAENHGGRIWLNSVPGEGTQVYVVIPDCGCPISSSRGAEKLIPRCFLSLSPTAPGSRRDPPGAVGQGDVRFHRIVGEPRVWSTNLTTLPIR